LERDQHYRKVILSKPLLNLLKTVSMLTLGTSKSFEAASKISLIYGSETMVKAFPETSKDCQTSNSLRLISVTRLTASSRQKARAGYRVNSGLDCWASGSAARNC